MSQENTGVIKRPFLKRGARMPVSRLPVDPTAPCVEAIKNPVKKPRNPSEFTPSDENEEPLFVARKVPSKSASSFKAPPVQVLAPPRPLPLKSAPRPSEAPKPKKQSPPRPKPRAFDPESSSDASLDFGLVSDSLDFSIPVPPSRVSTARVSAPLAPPAPPAPATTVSDYETQLLERSKVLDGEIARFKAENEKCRKLRVERERLLEETGRAHTALTVEREKFYEDKRQFEISTGKDGDRNERVKLLLKDLAGKDAEIRELREKLGGAETEIANKARMFKADRERLETRNRELEGKVGMLEAELKTACKSLIGKGSVVPTFGSSPVGETQSPQGTAGVVGASGVGAVGVISREKMTDGREEVYYGDGRKEVVFPSGLKKVFFADGSTSTVFQNGDKKEVTKEGATMYMYVKTGAKQTTYPNGLDVIEFATGQIERHFPDGSKEIIFANGSKKSIPPALAR